MDLSIIIVNWHSKEYLRKCIASILEATLAREYEILVIDSGSYDGCGEMLRQNYPTVRFIQSDRNLGFARANNEASKLCCGRNMLFLNPDTIVEAQAVPLLQDQLESLPDAGIVGPRLLNADRSVQTTCIRKFPTILNQMLNAEALMKWFPRSRLWGMAPFFDQAESPVGVDAVSGACLLIKRSIFETVGRFSTEYFMYSEDIDLCYKVLKAGWKTYYIPRATVVHHGGGSSSAGESNTFSSIMMMESRRRFFKKNRSAGYSSFYRLAVFAAGILRTGILLAAWPALALFIKPSPVNASLKKWIAIVRWTIGLENWVKNY